MKPAQLFNSALFLLVVSVSAAAHAQGGQGKKSDPSPNGKAAPTNKRAQTPAPDKGRQAQNPAPAQSTRRAVVQAPRPAAAQASRPAPSRIVRTSPAPAAQQRLEVNQMRLLHVGDKRIVVGRTAEGYVAFDDHCTHRGGSLAGGVMICETVQCPWHGSQFDVVTGDVKAGPAKKSASPPPASKGGGEAAGFWGGVKGKEGTPRGARPETKPSFRRRWVPGGCLGKVPSQQPAATFRQLQTNMN